MNSYFNSLWFHDGGLIKLKFKETGIQEDAIFHTVINCFLYKNPNHRLVKDHIRLDGQLCFVKSPENMTAIITYCSRCNLKFSHIKIWPNFWHPRDAIYIAYLQKRWWAYPLLPILFLIFLDMALTRYERKPNLWRWVLQGYPHRIKVRKTKNEILFWLRLGLPKHYKFIHWTGKIIVPLLQRKFGKDYLQGMMDLCYRDPEHPNRNYKDNNVG